jgi:polysaccharide biosynthesis/export protein
MKVLRIVRFQPLTRKTRKLGLCLTGALATFLAGAYTGAYAQQPNLAGAMQAYQSLSPDQQQAILQRLTGQGGMMSGSLRGPSTQGSANSGRNQGNAGVQNTSQTSANENAPPEEGIPVFAAEDWVLLDINLPGEKSVAQQAADVYARELNAAAIEKLSAQSGQVPLNAAQIAASQAQGANAASPSPNGAAPASAANAAGAGGNNPTLGAAGQRQSSILNALDQRMLDARHSLIKTVRANNPYQLDRDGALLLPGFRAIALAGLTEAEATRRVAAEPALADFEIRVTRLPVKKTGPESLKPYGYDLFLSNEPGLAPVTSIPVPPDYVLGPDDVLEVQLYGSQNYSLDLRVNRDGRINFPQLGAISVGGQRYSAVKRDIEARVEKQMIGVRASVSIGEARTINVFVLGEAMIPGTYTVTGLATVTTALFAAGGVKKRGSLRHIQVRRQGALVREFDLYDLLMRGDSSADVKLLPGDVVMVPSVGPTASAYGEVQRPAIYELKGPTNVAQLIEMAGGLTPEADNSNAALTHVNAQRQRVVVGVDLANQAGREQPVGNGDALRVARLKPTIDSGITLQGYVYRPGNYAWHEGLRLTDVIDSIDELKPNADQHYVLIRRLQGPGRQISVLSADLAAAINAPNSAANVLLQPRDTLTVFDLQTGRDRVIEPLMQELAIQSNLQQPTQAVNIDGRVKVPGDYPLETGMRVSDLIRAGGGLDSSAYGGRAELSRYTVDGGEQRRTEIITIDLAAVAKGDAAADIELKAFDKLSVKEITGWTEQDQVTVIGEVRFPGMYTIKRGETLRSVMARAGGLTEYAFPQGAARPSGRAPPG